MKVAGFERLKERQLKYLGEISNVGHSYIDKLINQLLLGVG